MGPWRTLLLAGFLVGNMITLMRLSIPAAPTQGPMPGGAAPTSVILPAPPMELATRGTDAQHRQGWHAGRGVVTHVDAAEQMIEIKHDAIGTLGIVAGKSSFMSVSPSLPTMHPGMRVLFYLDDSVGDPVITRIVQIVPSTPDLLELRGPKGANETR